MSSKGFGGIEYMGTKRQPLDLGNVYVNGNIDNDGFSGVNEDR